MAALTFFRKTFLREAAPSYFTKSADGTKTRPWASPGTYGLPHCSTFVPSGLGRSVILQVEVCMRGPMTEVFNLIMIKKGRI